MLTLIRRALKPGGTFYASYKTGEGDGRDTLDRYYNYPIAGLAARHLRQRGQLDFIGYRDRRSQGL